MGTQDEIFDAEVMGEQLKKLRKSTKLSQEKFALSIGMDRTYYSSVEAGKRNLSIQNIEKIALGLNVSLDELFSRVQEIRKEREDIWYG